MRRVTTALLFLLYALTSPLVGQSTAPGCARGVISRVSVPPDSTKTISGLTCKNVHDTVTKVKTDTLRLPGKTDTVYVTKPDTVKPVPPTPPDTAKPAPTGPNEPTPSGKILKADKFDSYTTSPKEGGWEVTPTPSDVTMTAAGRSGKAVSINYTPSAFYSGFDFGFSATPRIMVSYWFKIAPTGYDVAENDNTNSGMKWFTLWRSSDPRQTWGANHLGGVSGTTFGTHDNSSPDPEKNPSPPAMPNPVNGPSGLWNKVSDGQWHRYTIEAVTGDAGYEKCWLDGVLIFDTTGRGYHRSSQGFTLLQIGHDKVRAPSKNFQILIDDFTAWVP